MQKDEGKGGPGKNCPPKGFLTKDTLIELPALSQHALKILAFMRGEPVDFGKINDAREVLFADPKKENSAKKG